MIHNLLFDSEEKKKKKKLKFPDGQDKIIHLRQLVLIWVSVVRDFQPEMRSKLLILAGK